MTKITQHTLDGLFNVTYWVEKRLFKICLEPILFQKKNCIHTKQKPKKGVKNITGIMLQLTDKILMWKRIYGIYLGREDCVLILNFHKQ